MTVKELLDILNGFNRYVTHMNNHGYDDVIESVRVNDAFLVVGMRGHLGETYEQKVYLSSETGELCVEDTISGDSILDFLSSIEDYGLTKEVLHYIKYGKGGK